MQHYRFRFRPLVLGLAAAVALGTALGSPASLWAQANAKPAAEAEAPAEDAARARQFYEKGMAHFQLDEFAQAIEMWEAGFRAKPVPEFLYNIAQAYRLSKQHEKALNFYRKYLRMSPDARNRAEVNRHIAALERLVDQEQKTATRPPVDVLPEGKSKGGSAGALGSTGSVTPPPLVSQPSSGKATTPSPATASPPGPATATAPSPTPSSRAEAAGKTATEPMSKGAGKAPATVVGKEPAPTAAQAPPRPSGAPVDLSPRHLSGPPPETGTEATVTRSLDHDAAEDERSGVPVYRKGWFWAVVGGGAAVLAAGALVALSASKPAEQNQFLPEVRF